jgi:hypothetical protein
LPPGALAELQPLFQSQPQPQNLFKAQPEVEPLVVPLPSPGALPFDPVSIPPGGKALPPSGVIVPDLPQAAIATPQTSLTKEIPREGQPAEHEEALTDAANVTARRDKLDPEAPEQTPAPDAAAPAVTTKWPDPPPASIEPAAHSLPHPMPTSPSPPSKGALTPPASPPVAVTEAPAPDAGLPETSLSVPPPSATSAPTIALLPSPVLPLGMPPVAHAPAERAVPGPIAVPAPILPTPAGIARRGAAVAKQAEAGAGRPLLAVPSAAPPLSASTLLVIAPVPGLVTDPEVADALLPSPPAPRTVGRSPAFPAQGHEPQVDDPSKALPRPLPGGAEPAGNSLIQPAAGPADDAASPPPSLVPDPVPTLASSPPTAMPAAQVVAAASEPVAVPEPARAAPSPQLEETITAVSDLREALRAARPEMTLRHAEFGAVSLRLEAAGAQDWRVVLASRDPGFVPAIQAALAERAVAAAAETSLGGGGGASGGQNGAGEPRYGSSPGSGQGGSQPYSGQSPSRDESGFAHHQQQRQQRGSGTPAAADARSQAGDGAPRERGLFA